MKRWSLVIALFAGLSLLSSECQKDNHEPDINAEFSEFTFGSAYGFCAGNCVHLFQLIDGKIYADLMDRGNPADATFSDSPLSDAKYRRAAKLMEEFPDALFDEPKNTFGCPNCHDQGEYYLRVKKDGETFEWHLDTKVSALPEYLRPYAELMGEVVTDLRE